MGLKEREAVGKFDLERVIPLAVARILHRGEFSAAKLCFQRIDDFHGRPSAIGS